MLGRSQTTQSQQSTRRGGRKTTTTTHRSSSSSSNPNPNPNKSNTNNNTTLTSSHPNPKTNHTKNNQSQSTTSHWDSTATSATATATATATAIVDDHQTLPTLVGTCPFMCPVDERLQRERLRDLAVFERLNGNPRKSSPNLAVKKFCRTISAKHLQASDVRPLPLLQDTLNYLFNLWNSAEHPFEVVHEFIFDRTRSIRQDLSMQNVLGDQVIHMYERMVKFHVISHHELQRCCDISNRASMLYLNMEQLTKALMSLYNLYEANRTSYSTYENEAEFRSFYVLLHLSSDSQPMGESISSWFRLVPSPVIKSKEMRFARRVLRYFRLGIYKHFICTTETEASYLQYCIIEPHIYEIRALALRCLNYGGYKLHPYPLADLSRLLMMKESDSESFCNACGLQISTDEIGKKFLPTKQTSFCHPKNMFHNYCLLDSERLERESAECFI